MDTLYHRGEVLLPSQVKNPSIKVSDGKIVKIDTNNPRWIKAVTALGRRTGMPLVGRVRAKIAALDTERILSEDAQAAAQRAQLAKMVEDSFETTDVLPEVPTVPQESVETAKVAEILAKAQAAAAKKKTVK